jgi:hypothetical protein
MLLMPREGAAILYLCLGSNQIVSRVTVSYAVDLRDGATNFEASGLEGTRTFAVDDRRREIMKRSSRS